MTMTMIGRGYTGADVAAANSTFIVTPFMSTQRLSRRKTPMTDGTLVTPPPTCCCNNQRLFHVTTN
ncbi:hypothetical protein HanRHA438_Chr09g0415731 [Helianthus annuus]|nr:hypothetical protein HanRHA438_Chr09g0415731 [Helianthus annuus]